jgi:cytoskeletal protein RodZ
MPFPTRVDQGRLPGVGLAGWMDMRPLSARRRSRDRKWFWLWLLTLIVMLAVTSLLLWNDLRAAQYIGQLHQRVTEVERQVSELRNNLDVSSLAFTNELNKLSAKVNKLPAPQPETPSQPVEYGPTLQARRDQYIRETMKAIERATKPWWAFWM